MCCGGNRAAARAAAVAAGRGSAAAPSAASAISVTTEIMFEYAGRESASITGPVSGRVYRFTGPGDRVRVDARDRPGLASMSVLRWVR
jgi:hypothetical protein